MSGIATEKIVLHIFDKYLSEDEKKALAKEIQASPEAQEQARKLKEAVDDDLRQNRQERIAIYEHMLDFIDGKVTSLNEIKFEKLLEEDPECKRVWEELKEPLPFEKLEASEEPVPPTLHAKIDALLAGRQKAKRSASGASSLSEKIKAAVQKLRPLLEPIPKFAFQMLSEQLFGAVEIEVTESILEIDAGGPGRVVKIFSPKDEELHAVVSDENGRAVFGNLITGKYKILIEGFEIRQMA